jgi:epoxyqueuosine reductase
MPAQHNKSIFFWTAPLAETTGDRMTETDLDTRLSAYAQTLEVDFFGVADLSGAAARAAILDQGGPEIARYPRAIALGIALMNPIVDQLPRRAEKAVSVSYRHHAYDVVNLRLDDLASRLASFLQRQGHAALPVPASKRFDDERIASFFSHKIAANLAGLGWIGRSCLLITPQAGPRVRWISILTDAPLHATGSPLPVGCDDCHRCVDICPVQAFSGRLFDPAEPREARFDARKCEAYFSELEKAGRLPVCGMCLYVCPHGRQA